MSARTKARTRALEALYAAELRGESALELLGLARANYSDRQNQDEIFDYAQQIVAGIADNQTRIDSSIELFAHDWPLYRMPVIDRNLARIAVWELLFNPAVPNQVAISEAVSLARELSTDESSKFLGGLLSEIAGGSKPL